jgi:hypothetical protein
MEDHLISLGVSFFHSWLPIEKTKEFQSSLLLLGQIASNTTQKRFTLWIKPQKIAGRWIKEHATLKNKDQIDWKFLRAGQRHSGSLIPGESLHSSRQPARQRVVDQHSSIPSSHSHHLDHGRWL